MQKSRIRLALGTALGLSCSAHAAPAWQTIKTEHFNIHYTQGHLDWARSAAEELEVVRDKVIDQQNRSLATRADVVVFDPYQAANGFALPSTDKPLMALFTTPPQSDTVISNSSGWQQLLVLHEYIHLIHLSQPSRHKWKQAVRDIWDSYDLAHAIMPRWVAEGYATLMESKMTGRGRLFDNYTEAILTHLAREGALLPYSALNNGNGSYLSGSMAYLIGARYLAWIENNYGEETLDAVWTRMQGIESRDFDKAFKGVFGAHPKKLYKRFVAEYTYQSMASGQTLPELQSQLWHDIDFDAKGLRVSPNGEFIAVIERSKKGHTTLNVYSTEENQKAATKFKEAQQAILDNDPQDVADIPPDTFGRTHKHRLTPENFAGIRHPRWVDNNTLYFVASAKDHKAKHRQQGELFRWRVDSNEVEQLTHNAGIRRFAVSDSGERIYAEKVAYGFSELIELDLNTQQSQPLFSSQLGEVFDYPELSSDNAQLAYLKVGLNDNWQLYIQDLTQHSTLQVPTPKGYQYLTHPTWSHDDKHLYYVAGKDSQVDLYRYTLATKELRKLTQGQAVIGYPQQLPSGDMVYLSVQSDGPDIHLLTADRQGERITELSQTVRAHKVSTDTVQLPNAKIYTPVLTPQKYDIWQQSASLTLAEQYHSASAAQVQVGVKGSDFLDKLSWHVGLSSSVNNDSLSGGFASTRYRGDAWQLDAKLFHYDLDTLAQTKGLGEQSHKHYGGSVQLAKTMSWNQFNLTGQVAGHYSDKDTTQVNGTEQWLRVGFEQNWSWDKQSFAIGQSISANWFEGKTAEQDWDGYDVHAKVLGKAAFMPMYMEFKQISRDGIDLNLGGFKSSLLDSNVLANTVFQPDLPFYAATGSRYQRYGGGVAIETGAPWFYYQQHQVDNQVFAQTYGAKWSSSILGGGWSDRFAPAGVSDIRLEAGVSRVESDNFENENRFWLGFWFDLK